MESHQILQKMNKSVMKNRNDYSTNRIYIDVNIKMTRSTTFQSVYFKFTHFIFKLYITNKSLHWFWIFFCILFIFFWNFIMISFELIDLFIYLFLVYFYRLRPVHPVKRHTPTVAYATSGFRSSYPTTLPINTSLPR